MRSEIEDFKTGWYGIKLLLTEKDIDRLMEYLRTLKGDRTYHFHLFTTAIDEQESGIADIEFSFQDEHTQPSNMEIGA